MYNQLQAKKISYIDLMLRKSVFKGKTVKNIIQDMKKEGYV